MGILNIKDLKADMVLADDLKDRSGRLLITKGTVLDEKHLKICKMWGVIEANIEGVSTEEVNASAVNELSDALVSAATKSVHKRFYLTDMEHPAIQELVRLSILRTAEGRKIDHDNYREVYWFEQEIEDMERKKPLNIRPDELINDQTKLATLPGIYHQILDAISKPNSSAHDIENVISKDPSLSVRLLKIVNSAFYGYPSKIDTLSRAVNIVGTKQLSTLAIGVKIICAFKDIPSEIVNMKMFWKHSILCGICARILAGYKNIQNTERMFVAGLIHDIGRLVLYNYLPRESCYIMMQARKNKHLLFQEERNMFGIDHAMIGGQLLAKWQMPMSLEDTVQHHHDPQKSKNRLESSIIHLSDIIANTMGVGTSGEKLSPPLDPEAWRQIGLTSNVLSLTIDQADHQLDSIFDLIYIDEGSRQKKY
ncbi:MAG: hypothetical protein CSYNP_00976 [Syntrophus sp. SKADARSKE-3]|nr:hypothetical protein [Syntrophus sp. SKADARSKE-3]